MVISITIGFFSLFFFYSVDKGAIKQVIDNIIDTGVGHIQVHRKGYLQDPDVKKSIKDPDSVIAKIKSPAVAAITKRIKLTGIIASPEETRPVQAFGGVFPQERRLTVFDQYVEKGRFPREEGEILLGKELAELLKVGPGDKVVITSSSRTGDLSSYAFRVCGIFKTPSLDVNKYVVLISFKAAEVLAGYEDEANEIVLKLKNSRNIAKVKEKIKKELGPEYEVLSWDEVHPLLKYEMDAFSQMMLLFGFIILLAAAFGIAEVFFMSVYERMREIGIMRAMGLRPGVVTKLILCEAFLLSLVSVAAGGLISAVFYLYFSHRGIDLSIFSQSLELWGSGSLIHPYITLEEVFLLAAMVFLIVFLSVIFPIRKARRISAVEALRYV